MMENQYYHNEWFYYDMGEKIPATFREVTAIVKESMGYGDETAEAPEAVEAPEAAEAPDAVEVPDEQLVSIRIRRQVP
jgi:hypothetical protein